MSSGGGASAPTRTTVENTNIPEWAKPYSTKLLGSAESLVYNQPYQTYTGQRFAGLNPLQSQAMQQLQQQQTASQLGQATGMAGLAGCPNVHVKLSGLGTFEHACTVELWRPVIMETL